MPYNDVTMVNARDTIPPQHEPERPMLQSVHGTEGSVTLYRLDRVITVAEANKRGIDRVEETLREMRNSMRVMAAVALVALPMLFAMVVLQIVVAAG